MNRSAIKQLKDLEPMIVYFGVKYYAADPCKLAEEITRYQFFLQCKQDILHSRLPVSFELAIELFALAVQSELGDYDPQRHLDGYVSEFEFLPNQSVDLEKRVALYHRQLTGQVPATAEINFLERVKWLDLYGCDIHPIQYEEDEREQYALGLNPSGILVLRNKLKVAHYLWKRIVKAKCQGRCFLMDVIDVNSQPDGKSAGATHRFGFRLIDKEASLRLRWAFEEHKSFHTLIHTSASLNQMSQRRDGMKLSQKFRHSIRSAINATGQFASIRQQQQYQQQQQQNPMLSAQQQKLRSSSKSMHIPARYDGHNSVIQQQHRQQSIKRLQNGQQYSTIDSRPASKVVRMPSRRYSNRSLVNPRLANQATGGPPSGGPYDMANGNGLPNVGQPPLMQQQQQQQQQPHSQTMLDSQRQRAILMMSQYNQYNGNAGKSQTLRPLPASKYAEPRDAARKIQQYQQHMMMMNGRQQPPDFSVVPPGRHLMFQPTIYKANGISKTNSSSQMDLHQRQIHQHLQLQLQHQQQQQQQQMQQQGPLMHLFPIAQQVYPGGYKAASGCESPKSSKSAIAPSSAIKMASKKLAKQHLLYQQQQQQVPEDMQALLGAAGYDMASQQQQAQYYSAMMSASANPSPRSVRSARLSAQHKSKSTNENLHLLHQQLKLPAPQLPPLQAVESAVASVNKANRMLLATAANWAPMQPPGYNPGSIGGKHHYSDQENNINGQDLLAASLKLNRSRGLEETKKRAALALNQEQANLLLDDETSNNDNNNNNQQRRTSTCNRRRVMNLNGSESDEDYCCSRSDCSSFDIEHSQYQQAGANGLAYQRDRQHLSGVQQAEQARLEWQAMRQNEFVDNFNAGNYAIGQAELKIQQKKSPAPAEANNHHDDLSSTNISMHTDKNNNLKQSQLVKNIANKQATPILLSMNYVEDEDGSRRNDTNNKAVQLLNSQRQQLNSQSSSSSSEGGIKSSSSPPSDSVPSSAASSPKNGSQPQSILKMGPKKAQTGGHSSASSSNTSGYYAGSNSTGSASLDSDNNQQVQKSAFNERQASTLKQIQWEQEELKHDWKDQDSKGPRAKIY